MGARTSADVLAGEDLKLLGPSRGARRVGRYLLCDQIGSGGMATIHLARLLGPQGFSRTVAIKQLHPQFAQNPQFVAMLLDEARLAVRVRHVNVVSPLDIVATESELFIVMDYVNGESLANLLAASEVPPPPTFAAAILVQALLGLHAAHEATREQGDALGLVHRDVSPQNILVGQDGVARMVDFGIAKAVARTQTTDGGMVKGKLGYMAPEQIKLEPVDRRSDLFSAGVVLWEALTGDGLFVSDTLGGSIERILHGEIAPPSRFNPAVTPELDAVVLKALERNRDARFQDAMSMAAALQGATPLASALEVIDWVEKLAGPELERKAGLVKRVESMYWEPAAATSSPLGVAALESRATRVHPGRAEAAPVASNLPRRTPTLLGIATPRDGQRLAFDAGAIDAGASAGTIGGSALAATGESTGVAVGGDRAQSATAEGKSHREWKSKGLTLGIVLAGVAAALGVLAFSEGTRERWFDVARQPLAARPAVALEVTAPPPDAPTPVRNEPPPPAAASLAQVRPVPSELAPSPPPQAEPIESDDLQGSAAGVESSPRVRPARATRGDRASTRPSGSSARRSAAAQKSASSAGSASVRGGNAEGKSSRRGTPSEAPARASSDRCNPPWVINAQQVKVFKAECLR
jgi:eukaryotic-like serine/threonine-protein kinase